jgi:glucose-6-phosphate 1-dehydrogenase
MSTRNVVVFFHYLIDVGFCSDRAAQRFDGSSVLPPQSFDGRKIAVSHVTLSANGFGNDVKAVQCIVIKLQRYLAEVPGYPTEENDMAVTQTAQACDLVIFGAKGDLARRKLLPSCINWKKRANFIRIPVSWVSGAPTGTRTLIPKSCAKRSKLS